MSTSLTKNLAAKVNKLIKLLYEESDTVRVTDNKKGEKFQVEEEVLQRWLINTCLFILVMEIIIIDTTTSNTIKG